MTRNEYARLRDRLLTMAGCALGYMMMDLPVQATRFFRFGTAVGIKNFLPPVLGIILGPAGCLGCAAGCAGSSLILSTPFSAMAAECASVLICGLSAWAGWHLGGGRGLSFKRAVDYLRYILLLAVSAAVSGAVWRLIAGPGGLPLAVAYITAGSLVGIPVLILAGSIFCIDPVLPRGREHAPQVSGRIDSDPDSIGAFNDLLEEKLLLTGSVSMKRLFELQNVVEEVSLMTLGALPGTVLEVSVDCHDSCSVRFRCEGERFNPLKTRRDGDEVDLMSLKLIRHRALRASHTWSGGVNRVHIVI